MRIYAEENRIVIASGVILRNTTTKTEEMLRLCIFLTRA